MKCFFLEIHILIARASGLCVRARVRVCACVRACVRMCTLGALRLFFLSVYVLSVCVLCVFLFIYCKCLLYCVRYTKKHKSEHKQINIIG